MHWRSRCDRGGVTAEFAVALPAVILLLAFCLSGLRLAAVQVRVQDAAAVAARALARGDHPSDLVSQLVPGSTVSRSRDGDFVCASVRTATPVAPLLRITLVASSCALDGGR